MPNLRLGKWIPFFISLPNLEIKVLFVFVDETTTVSTKTFRPFAQVLWTVGDRVLKETVCCVGWAHPGLNITMNAKFSRYQSLVWVWFSTKWNTAVLLCDFHGIISIRTSIPVTVCILPEVTPRYDLSNTHYSSQLQDSSVYIVTLWLPEWNLGWTFVGKLLRST